MGLHRQLPDGLRRLRPRFRTPWIGIILFGGVGNIRIAGRELPPFAIVGGLGTLLAFVTVTALHLDVAAAGVPINAALPELESAAQTSIEDSIYYALGLVAAHALGLTPVVFMLAGGLFALTAKTYAEGASMFPEAGGSSSFARQAFNELVSFFAGWALSLDYILTIAISAFFVPHYLGAFFPALTHGPGDVIGGIVVIVLLAVLNIRGLGESAKLNCFLPSPTWSRRSC